MQNRLFKLLLIFLFSLTATLGHATAGGKQAQAEAAILATLAKGLVGEGVGVVAIKGTQLSIQSAKVVVQKTRQTVKFSTDDLGRINKVEGKLDLDIKDRNSHQQNSQLITSMLNGPGGKTKLLSGNLNEGEWRKLEKEWMSALKEGKSVKVSVEPVYSGNSTRPESFKINYFIDDRLTQKVFQNTASKGGTVTQTTTGGTITQVTEGGQKLLTNYSRKANLNQSRLEHIVERHWHSSGAKGAGKFSQDVGLKELRSMINDTVAKGSVRANTRGRPGHIFEHDFGSSIGTNIGGNAATRMRVVVGKDGNVVTAFPY